MSINTQGDAVQLARAYLNAMERRDLLQASTYLAPEGAVLVFPGGVVRTSPTEIARGSARRYQFVGKRIEAWESFEAAPGTWTVYCRGTLHGRWPNGTPFEGIRFIDRFEIDRSGIRRQDVWNDSAEYRLAVHATENAEETAQ